MKSLVSKLLAVCFAVVTAFTFVAEAEAKRLGGGKTVGKQQPNAMQREAAPQQPAAAPAATQSGAAAAGQQAAAAGQRSKWMAPLAGLAAGLGIAALASWLGFGEELASFMMLALLAVAVLVIVRMVMARRGAAAGPKPAFQGATAYSAAGVGQEASVRYAPAQGAIGGVQAPVVGAPAAAAVSDSWRIPADFDVAGFVRNAKVMFVRLQAAHDAGNLDDLREFTSPEMFAEIKLDIDERKGAASRTDVVTLEAELLGIETTAVEHLASVRFHGMIREDDAEAAKPFDEVWNLSKPVSGQGGWMLAGVQQLS